jgi:hypothetical protein
MAITVTELAERLNAEAARRRITAEQLLEELAARLLAPSSTPAQTSTAKRHLAFAAIGASSSGRTAREADEMLADGFGRA